MTWQHYVVAGAFAGVTAALAFVLGTGLIAVTGIPATGGFANLLVCSIVISAAGALIDRKGGFVLVWILTSVFLIPTVIIGPPGLQKVLIAAIAGVFSEMIVLSGRKSTTAYFIAFAVAAEVLIWLTLIFLIWVGLPAAGALKEIIGWLSFAYALLGGLGGVLGKVVHDRVLRTTVVADMLKDSRG